MTFQETGGCKNKPFHLRDTQKSLTSVLQHSLKQTKPTNHQQKSPNNTKHDQKWKLNCTINSSSQFHCFKSHWSKKKKKGGNKEFP